MSTVAKLWPACVSALQLDKLRMGEPVPDEVRAHVASCAKCGEMIRGLQPDEPLPPLRVVPLAARRRTWPRVVAGLSVAAAASLVFALRPAPGERTKGPGISLAMYVDHLGEVRQVEPGGSVSAGDAVRFAVTMREARFVGVLSLDPRGHASIYVPITEVHAGEDHPLPLATRLDATVGKETIVGLFCAGPVDLNPLRAALERGSFSAPDGCRETRWSFVKR